MHFKKACSEQTTSAAFLVGPAVPEARPDAGAFTQL